MLVRARLVLPQTAPPVEDGAVLIFQDRVRAVGRYADLRPRARSVLDLGDVALLPGLVNAHCHLDYTNLGGRLAPPKSFPDWIKSILAAKSEWNFSDFAASWLAGARQLVESGTTTVANIESVPEMLAECRAATPLRVYSFLEMTGVRSARDPAVILEETVARARSIRTGRGQIGLSPHAPYSTSPALLQLTAERVRSEGWWTTTHVAESQAEFDMYMYRRGPMYAWLEPQRAMTDCGVGSPVQHLERCGLLGPKHLAVHVNYLWDGDAARLARTGTHVVHCPSSHTYFGHRRFPYEELVAAGVNVALGTDSLASTKGPRGRRPTLSLFDELRELLANDATLSPQDALDLVTTKGARALGLTGLAGELTDGGWADLIAVPYVGSPDEVADAVVHHSGPVSASMIAGEWARSPVHLTTA
ncbi:MAG: amidohydrolase family protein [Verrucomicrobia bacterium]|nr:amidohydrolase family protein [Verrucomicrobiota bacterium]